MPLKNQDILKRYWEGGLRSTKVECHRKIEECAREAGLSVQQVAVSCQLALFTLAGMMVLYL